MEEDVLDLHLVEETARYAYRIMAAKIMFANPRQFGFHLKASDLYVPIPYKEITITEGIANLADWAKKQGTTDALLKRMNPWLRQDFIQNKTRRTYVLKIPLEEGLLRQPKRIVPHDKRWIKD